MLKNVVPFRLTGAWPFSLEKTAEQLIAFVPCGPQDMQSSGFVNVREDAGLVLAIQDHWLLRLRTETKLLPGRVVKKHLEKRLDAIRTQENRKVGRKEKLELKQRIIDMLLPKAESVENDTLLWIDHKRGTVCIHTGNRTRGEEALNALRKGLDPNPQLSLIPFTRAPSDAMRNWIIDDAPAGFTVDDRCELVLPSEKSSIRYVHHSLGDDVVSHLSQGKIPKSLAMTWNDKVSFVLTADFEIKSIKLLDAAKADYTPGEGPAERFDGEIFLDCEEIGETVKDIVHAIGENV